MRTYRFAVPLIALLLTGCAGAGKPVISFIGIGTGTLATDLNTVQFGQTFKTTDTSLVAAIAFDYIADGTRVQATWFSPDDRSMPLGRTEITTESGAQVARFSFGSREEWKPAPYMLIIDAQSGQGETMKRATGSLSFFIGMEDDDIRAYLEDFQKYKQEESAQIAEYQAEADAKSKLIERVSNELGFKHGSLVYEGNLLGDEGIEYVIDDKEEPQPFMGSPGVQYTGTVSNAAVINASGATIFAITDGEARSGDQTLFDELPSGDVQMTILPSSTISLSWQDGEKTCSVDLTWSNGNYQSGDAVCR